MPPLDLTTLSAASLAWCLGLHCSPWDPTDCLMLPKQRTLHQAVARILPLTADSSAELSAPTISGLSSTFKEGHWLWGTKQWLGIRKMQVGGYPTADNTGWYSLLDPVCSPSQLSWIPSLALWERSISTRQKTYPHGHHDQDSGHACHSQWPDAKSHLGCEGRDRKRGLTEGTRL